MTDIYTMEGKLDALLQKPLLLIEIVKKDAEETDFFKRDCVEINQKVETLAELLQNFSRLFQTNNTSSLYERPAQRILTEVSITLEKALVVLKKCKKTEMIKRMVNIMASADMGRVNSAMDCAIGDVSWLLRMFANGQGGKRGGMEGLPPIASTDPMLAWVWGQIALVHMGSPTEKEEGASYLTSIASDKDRNRVLVIEEGGIPPLLKLLKHGITIGGRLAALDALGALGANNESMQQIYEQGAIPIFARILQDGPPRVQAKVAWAIAKMASQAPDATAFSTETIIKPLVSLLALEAMDMEAHKPSRGNAIYSSARINTILRSSSVVEEKVGWNQMMMSMGSDTGKLDDQWDTKSTHSDIFIDKKYHGLSRNLSLSTSTQDLTSQHPRHTRGFSDSYDFHGLSRRERQKKGWENEDPEIKKELKIQVTSALWKLAENNVKNCRKIVETKALICFAKLMGKETDEALRKSVMAVMEITAAAERDVEFRRFAFKKNSLSSKAVIDQLLRLIQSGPVDVQVPCLKAIGSLSRIFPDKETKVIHPLVHQLGNPDPEVAAEAARALEKFAHTSNFLHLEHSKAIVDANAVPLLLQLVGSDHDKDIQVPALILLSYLAMHVGDADAFREYFILKTLKNLARTTVAQIQSVHDVLSNAIQHLELY